MNLVPKETLILCPANDLESKAILAIARRHLKDKGFNVKESAQPWGARLEKEEIPEEPKQLVIVEIPGLKREWELRRNGREVIVIDHHDYGSLMRWHPLSSLEQFVELFKAWLPREQKNEQEKVKLGALLTKEDLNGLGLAGMDPAEAFELIAANDREYVYGMAEVLIARAAESLKDESSEIVDDLLEKRRAVVDSVLKKVERIREADRKAQGITDEDYCKAKEEAENAARFHRVSVAETKHSVAVSDHLCSLQPKAIAQAIAAMWRKLKSEEEDSNSNRTSPVPVRSLFLISRDQEGIKGAGYSGPYDEASRLFRRILESVAAMEPEEAKKMGYYCNRTPRPGRVRPLNFHGGLRSHDPSDPPDWDKIFDVALRVLLEDDPVLSRHRAIFIYPFRIDAKEDKRKEKFEPGKDWKRKPFFCGTLDPTELIHRDQEYLYFHDYIRQFFFDTGEEARGGCERSDGDVVEYYEYEGGRDADFEIEYYEEGDPRHLRPKCLRIKVGWIAIHKFFYNIAILAVAVEAEEPDELLDMHYWKRMIGCCRHGLLLKQAMQLHFLGRQLYKSFPEQAEEGKLPKKVRLSFKGNHYATIEEDFSSGFVSKGRLLGKDQRPPLSNIIRTLVGTFLGADGSECTPFRHIFDYRTYVHAYICLSKEGEAAFDKRSDVLLARLLYIDRFGLDWEYDEEFLKGIFEPALYDRFKQYGTRYAFCRYADCVVGRGGYFFEKVIPHHFEGMYYQMTIIAIYYRTALVEFARKIGEITPKIKEDWKGGRKGFTELRERFMEFANRYWFKELTHQDQGIEMFDIQRRVMNLDRLFEDVNAQIEKTHEYLENRYMEDLQSLSSRLERMGLPLALFVTLLTLFSISRVTSWHELWEFLCGVGIPLLFSMIMIVIVIIVGWLLLKLFLFIRNRKRKAVTKGRRHKK